jgi:hypothetical protein
MQRDQRCNGATVSMLPTDNLQCVAAGPDFLPSFDVVVEFGGKSDTTVVLLR